MDKLEALLKTHPLVEHARRLGFDSLDIMRLYPKEYFKESVSGNYELSFSQLSRCGLTSSNNSLSSTGFSVFAVKTPLLLCQQLRHTIWNETPRLPLSTGGLFVGQPSQIKPSHA